MKLRADAFAAQTRAVVIGIGSYRSAGFAKLKSPETDATRVAEALRDPAGCGIPTDQVTCLTTEQGLIPTRSKVLEAIQEAVELTPEDGTLIVYFGGHGAREGDHFFLCTTEANADNLSKTCVGDADLDTVLMESVARGVIVILDCCESASFAELAPSFFRRLGNGEFRILLSASRADERSWEFANGGGTLFTRYLIRALRGEDAVSEPSGAIYFGDLLNYLRQRVADDIEGRYKDHPPQEPVFCGVYSEDPLLFVHRGLTLRQIRFKTNRYSRDYMRRIIRRLVFGSLVSTV